MKTIVWDVDDVLNDLMKAWLEGFWLPARKGGKISYEEISTNPPNALLGSSREEYLASLDDFRLSGRYAALNPIPEVKKWFIANGEKCRHVALTRVPAAVSHVSAAWVMKNFGLWIRSFHFVPSYRAGENPPVYDEDKGTYLNYFGKADLLIDDTMDNIEAAKRAGVETIIFPQPWNSSKRTIGETLDEVLSFINKGTKK